ncbi:MULTISPECIES: M48 family metalloprotease [Idiomarina]|uniref:beta-barrel assembly-enhancing protease n=1 Tax=Idiomarina TaxID=135575 RepID=UPI00129BCF42|nr:MULTISPECIES: M48 family metalloprotease [Idiomarina]MRJ41404.1 M48 family metalloprotease [Idiomarina sp. FeN1]NCU56879.1 M48 family metalloprotease [Idiomarina sp. FenA--70]NCU59588.1 M48 family metalloprotease [Idiomarina sp. FenBw--71]UUN14240.1 M48 family metallopeptidase [Idiomarina loihiensis]
MQLKRHLALSSKSKTSPKAALKTSAGAFSAIALSLLLSLSATTSTPVCAQDRLPEIGTAGAGVMSIERELIYGDLYMRQIRATAPLIHDPVLDEYLHDMGSRMVRVTDNVRFPYTFFWVNNDAINAFAFFGGHIGVHTGLIAAARTESELAAVVGHEIAHVSQRHIVRNMERMQANSATTMSAFLGSLLLAVINPTLGMAAMTTTTAGAQQVQINYTRQFEQEADRVGIDILARAGFDPNGAPDFFGRLAEQYRYATRLPEFLQTHPYTESRVADTRQRVALMPRVVKRDEQQFWLAKIRAETRHLRQKSEAELQRAMSSNVAEYATAARYGLAIWYLDNNQHQQAAATLAPLLQADPRNTFYLDVQTDILLGQERYDEALRLLEQAYMRQPNERTITLNFANAAVKARKFQLAIDLLRDFLQRNPQDIVSLDLLSTAYRLNGNISGMYEVQADLAALHGAFDQSINYLHSAHKQNAHDLDKRRLQARIDKLMEQKRQVDELRN